MLKFFGVLFLLGVAGFIALVMIGAHVINKPEAVDQAATVSAASAVERVQDATPMIKLPDDERAFVATVFGFKTHYDEAANEFQKSTVRRQRAAALAQLFPAHAVATEWVGTISVRQTNSDGNGYVEIKPLGQDKIALKTWNNALSDIGSDTLMPASSPLYEAIAALSLGQKVTFSAVFLPGDMDYLKEASMTELGAMEEPEFIVRFMDPAHGNAQAPNRVDARSAPG